MFRRPRDAIVPDAIQTPLRPSTGRPPTPPISTSFERLQSAEAVRYTMTSSTTSLLGRSKTLPKPNGRSPAIGAAKTKGKTNTSILSFFKKADPFPVRSKNDEAEEESLFLEDRDLKQDVEEPVQTLTPPQDYDSFNSPNGVASRTSAEENISRFNEEPGPIKRRRVEEVAEPSPSVTKAKAVDALRRGPFLEDSDSDDELVTQITRDLCDDSGQSQIRQCIEFKTESSMEKTPPLANTPESPPIPNLKRESTTAFAGVDDFEGIEDFIEDEFPEEGEEYLERRWMEEQKQFELGSEEDGELGTTGGGLRYDDTLGVSKQTVHDSGASSCPICSGSFAGITDQEASKHVNDCLDGKCAPLSSVKIELKSGSASPPIKLEKEISTHKRFQRTSNAKPGQENPFAVASNIADGSSAFSKLMSSHAEDAAWATAAAWEASSRGKPAYQRTCPFYKIMPGFFICVDAFRYGAVEGCKAYFLSHFHSDHYIGLTSSWCHGPIYCSHVTANLVRRQLRVDPKWVFDLDFDKKFEVPGTQGVEVTMIPANHCPGSSLYLFEKVIGKSKNPKVQRVLHCGDFRACPAHVQHPLLRPDIVDAVTQKNIAQQKLDVCYLDTTYLTPKYAFPSQEDVIKACADMCVSLSKDRVDESDSWEQTKKERAGSGMVKFVQSTSDVIKDEVVEDVIDMMRSNKQSDKKKLRGRLLVIVGTYSIGKERICLGVARALNSKIYAPPNKQKICAALEDPELLARLTSDPLEAQVHMQMLMEIRAETLADYLTGYKPHFSRIVGFRPSGWNYRPPNSRFVDSPAVQTVLHSDNWKSRYSMVDLVPQRGSTREANCFGVPYSEHSSFRELTMFCCALRIDKIIPTVNVGSAKSREKMKAWCEKWAMEKKKNGLFKVVDGQASW